MRRSALIAIVAFLVAWSAWSQESGSLQIQCAPGLEVYLNDVLYGKTTAEEKGLILPAVPAGVFNLVLAGEDIRHSRKISIQPGKTLFLQVDMETPKYQVEKLNGESVKVEAAGGTLSIRSLPIGAAIFVDGQLIERADFLLRNFPAGEHAVKARLSDTELTRNITLEANDEVDLLFDFKNLAVGFSSRNADLREKYDENQVIVLESTFRFDEFTQKIRGQDTQTSGFYMPDGSLKELKLEIGYENVYNTYTYEKGMTNIVHDVDVRFRLYLDGREVANGGYNPVINREITNSPLDYHPQQVRFTDQQGLLNEIYSSKDSLFVWQAFWSKHPGTCELITRIVVTKRFKIPL